jgi:hypothetical protein
MGLPSHPAASGERDNQEQWDQRAQGFSVEGFSDGNKVARVQGHVVAGLCAAGTGPSPVTTQEICSYSPNQSAYGFIDST